MKQRISVRAIVRREGKTLLLRRADGRPSIIGQYELPGGQVAYDEQPEDALRRFLHDDAGVHIQTAQLYDAVTYIDHDDRAIQYVVLVYLVSLAAGNHTVNLSNHYNKYEWKSFKNIQQDEVTDLTSLLLGIVQQQTITEKLVIDENKIVDEITSNDVLTIYSDGGSRGNPGPSAAGFVIVNDKQELVEQGGEYLGITTNGIAEYHGVRLGLERALELGYKRLDFRVDSMMVVNQMNGVYTIKNRELWPIHDNIKDLISQFEKIKFVHIPRELNQLADGVVNKTLDEENRERYTIK